MTPLLKWNPYKLKYKVGTIMYKTKLVISMQYNHTHLDCHLAPLAKDIFDKLIIMRSHCVDAPIMSSLR